MAVADNWEKEEQLEGNNAAYDNPTTLEQKDLKFDFEQNVSGTGFSASCETAAAHPRSKLRGIQGAAA